MTSEAIIGANIGLYVPPSSKIQTAAAAALTNNLVINPVSAAAGTIATPAVAPSTTGFTNQLAVTGGFIASITANTRLNSKLLTNVSSITGLVVGQPICETHAFDAYPTAIPIGAMITGITAGTATTTNTVEISIPALGTFQALTCKVFTPSLVAIGGIPNNHNNNNGVRTTTGGTVAAPVNFYSGYAYEFMTDAATFDTVADTILIQCGTNTGTPDAFRIAIDDVYQSADPVTLGASKYITITFAVAGPHKVRLEMARLHLLLALWTITGASIWAPKGANRAVVAAIGDSYFANGATNSWPMRNMASSIASLMGWSVDLIALGGTGYVATNSGALNTFGSFYRLLDLTARLYDGVVMYGSVNDNPFVATVAAEALKCWRNIRDKLPKAPMFIFGVSSTGTISRTLALALEAQLLIAFNIWRDPNAFFYPVEGDPAGAWITSGNLSTYIDADNVHLVDGIGTTYFAQKGAQLIRNTINSWPVV